MKLVLTIILITLTLIFDLIVEIGILIMRIPVGLIMIPFIIIDQLKHKNIQSDERVF